MKKIKIICLLGLCLLLCTLACKGFSDVFDSGPFAAFTPGATIEVAHASGGMQTAKVMDINGDGIADGIDLDGNGIPEVLYIAFGTERSRGLDTNGDGNIDYYLVVKFNGTVELRTARSGGSLVKITSDGLGPTGFDTDGNGTPDSTILLDIRNDVISSSVAASPASGNFTSTQTVTLTCTDNVSPNAISYTTDGTAPSFTVGGSNNIVPGNKVTLTASTSMTVQFRCRDAHGNLSGTLTEVYTIVDAANILTGVWAFSVTSAMNASRFTAVAVDSLSNIYAVGAQTQDSFFDYGTQSVKGFFNAGYNVVLVKYNAAGNALWARSANPTAPSTSYFNGVATDGSGNVYAAGYQQGTALFTYGTQGATGKYSAANTLLLKYNSSGTEQWAQTVVAGPAESKFYGVATDASGNVYAAGYQNTASPFDYGSGNVTGSNTGGNNVVLVKYNSAGVAEWARSTSAGSSSSLFNAVTLDSAGNVYAVGSQTGNSSFNYGAGSISINSVNSHPVVVKYSSAGTTLWSKTLTSGNDSCVFNAVAVDGSGNVYVAGYQKTTNLFEYATGVTASGKNGNENAVLVKYNSAGVAQWARTVSVGPNLSVFNAVAVDSSGHIYAAGYQSGQGEFKYGAIGAAGGSTGENSVLVRYDAAGNALWAVVAKNGTDYSRFNGVAVDASKKVYAAGYQNNTSLIDYGGSSVQGKYSSGNNVTIVKLE